MQITGAKGRNDGGMALGGKINSKPEKNAHFEDLDSHDHTSGTN